LNVLTLEQLREQVAELASLVVELRSQHEKLSAENALLQEENQRLRAELERRNGPPPFVKPNRPLRQKKQNEQQKKERRKRQQSFARQRDVPKRTVAHKLERCPDCDGLLSGEHVHRRRQVIDIPAHPVEVTEHEIIAGYCRACKKRHLPEVDFSDQVVGKCRLGIRLMSLVSYLRSVCRLPVAVIQQFLFAQYELKVSQGQIVAMTGTLAKHGQAACEEILNEVRQSEVINGDETGWRENGRNGYLWGFFTPTARYYHYDASRAGAVALAVLSPSFKQTLVTDFYAAYNGLRCRHQRCWPHLLRDLRKVKEAHPDNREIASWVGSIKELYEEAIAYQQKCRSALAEKLRALGYNRLQRRAMRRQFESRLGLIAAPFLDQKGPGADPRATLAERMEKFATELFVFIEYPDVPADNNRAERGLRHPVVSRKISGGTRSEKGSITFTTLATLFGTWKERREDLLLNATAILQTKIPKPAT